MTRFLKKSLSITSRSLFKSEEISASAGEASIKTEVGSQNLEMTLNSIKEIDQ
nr:hypothetical protein [Orenia metallireducens]